MRKAFVWLTIIAAFFVAYGRDVQAQNVVPPYRYGEQPVVLIPNIDNVALGELNLLNYWQFGDSPCGGTVGCTPGPCPSTIADLVASDTVAATTPSPVPLVTPVFTPGPPCGATGMVQDGTTAVEFTNGVLGVQGQWFSPATAGLLSKVCNNNAGGSCNLPFTIACVVDAGNISSAAYYFSADGTTTGLALGASFANGLILLDRGTAIQNFAMVASDLPYFVAYTFDGTSKSSVYLNGVLALATTSPLPQVSPNSVSYFGSETGAAGGWNGRIEKCQLRNDAATAADIRYQYNSTGFW